MTQSRTRRQRTWQAPGQIEGLEDRSLLSGISSQAAFDAIDNLNIKRLGNKMAIDYLRIANEFAVQTTVYSGKAATDYYLNGIAAARAAGDGQSAAFDLVNLKSVRSLMKRAGAIGSHVEHVVLLQRELNLNKVVIEAQKLLGRGSNPYVVQAEAGAALDQIYTNATIQSTAEDARIMAINAEINAT